MPAVPRRSGRAEGKQDALQVHRGRRMLMTAKSPAPRDEFHLQGSETESGADGEGSPRTAHAHPAPGSRAAGRRGAEFCPRQPRSRGARWCSPPGSAARPCSALHPERAGVCAHPRLTSSRRTWGGPSAHSVVRAPVLRGGATSHGHTAVTWGRQRNSTRVPPARFPLAAESSLQMRTARARFCPAARSPAPGGRAHSPGASLPAPRRPAPATRALASERARAQRPGARGRSGTQRAQLGARGGLGAPAPRPARPARAAAPITALCAGPGPAASARSEGPGPPRAARTPGPERRERASGERARGERGGGGGGGRAGAGEDGGDGRLPRAPCAAGRGATETGAPRGEPARAVGEAAAPPPRARTAAHARPSSAALPPGPSTRALRGSGPRSGQGGRGRRPSLSPPGVCVRKRGAGGELREFSQAPPPLPSPPQAVLEAVINAAPGARRQSHKTNQNLQFSCVIVLPFQSPRTAPVPLSLLAENLLPCRAL